MELEGAVLVHGWKPFRFEQLAHGQDYTEIRLSWVIKRTKKHE